MQTKKTLHNTNGLKTPFCNGGTLGDVFAELQRTDAANTLEGIANHGYGVTLEKRRGRQYFYTAERKNGRVVKKYLGKTDPFGSVIAGLMTLNRSDQRQLREKRRERWALIQDRARQDFQTLDTYLARSYDTFAAIMTIAGYHRPGRGPWRKRRGFNMDGLVRTDGIDRSREAEAWMNARIVNEAANNPKNEAACIRAIEILRDPKCLTSTNLVDDMSGVLKRFAGNNPVVKEMYLNQARTLWREMTGTLANSTEARKVPAVERILIERIIACRFALADAEEKRAEANTFKATEFAERNIDRAHRRLLSSVKCLAEVRRLGVPAVNVAMPGAMQINVGDKQVNAAMAPAPM